MGRSWGLCAAALAGAAAGGKLAKTLWREKYRGQGALLERASRERDLFYTWLLLEQKGAVLAEYFAARSYLRLAVLGMGPMGRRFVDAIQAGDGPAAVVYGVEASCLGAVHETLTVYRLGDDPLPAADCVVICDLDWTAEKETALRREFLGEAVTLAQVMAWLLEAHRIQPRDGAIAGWPPEEGTGST